MGLLQCALVFPGYVSFDVRSQLEQGRTGEIYDVSPPGHALLLGAFDSLLPGTGLLFLLNVGLLWGALAALCSALPLRRAHAFLLLALPPLIPLLPHVWSDLHLLSILAVASTLLFCVARAEDGPHRFGMAAAALLLLTWSTWVRHNAILAVVPLALCLAWMLPVRVPRPVRRVRVAAMIGLVLLLLIARAAAGLAVDRPVSVWAVTPLWDLQALSLRAERVLLPQGLVGPDMTVAELRGAFSPNTAVPLFGDTPSGVANPTLERLAAERRDALLVAWVSAVLADPQGWLAHRWTVFRRLFGAHRSDDLRYMVDSPEFLAGKAPDGMRGALHRAFRQVVEAGKHYGLFSPAPSLLLSLGLFALARRRGQGSAPALQWALLASAMLYVLALFPLTPSAEQRYLAWPMLACVLAAALALARGDTDAAEGPAVRR